MRTLAGLLCLLVAWLGAVAAYAGGAAPPQSLDCIACRADAGALLTAYPSFMPTVETTRVLSRADGRLSVLQHLRILFVDVRYSTLWTLDPARGLATWQLDESAPHDIAETSGSWQLALLPERDRTLVRYRASIDTGQPVPGPIERLLTRSSLPRVVRSVREEVQRRYGR